MPTCVSSTTLPKAAGAAPTSTSLVDAVAPQANAGAGGDFQAVLNALAGGAKAATTPADTAAESAGNAATPATATGETVAPATSAALAAAVAAYATGASEAQDAAAEKPADVAHLAALASARQPEDATPDAPATSKPDKNAPPAKPTNGRAAARRAAKASNPEAQAQAQTNEMPDDARVVMAAGTPASVVVEVATTASSDASTAPASGQSNSKQTQTVSPLSGGSLHLPAVPTAKADVSQRAGSTQSQPAQSDATVAPASAAVSAAGQNSAAPVEPENKQQTAARSDAATARTEQPSAAAATEQRPPTSTQPSVTASGAQPFAAAVANSVRPEASAQPVDADAQAMNTETPAVMGAVKSGHATNPDAVQGTRGASSERRSGRATAIDALLADGRGRLAEDAGPAEKLAAADAPQTPARTDRQALVDQIVTGLRASAIQRDKSITVQLHPVELGSVRLTVRDDGGVLRGHLEVANRSTLDDVRAETPALLNRLNESGVPLHRIDVVVSAGQSSSTASHTPNDSRGALSQQPQEQGQRQAMNQSASGALGLRAAEPVSVPSASETSVAGPAGGLNVWM